jgi:hypothetical protein
VFYQVLISFVFVHGGFANHGIHLLLNLIHKLFGALAVFQLNAESGKQYFLRCLVDVEVHDFGRGPSIRNRPDFSINELLDNVASTKNRTGQVECTFTIPDYSRSMIV